MKAFSLIMASLPDRENLVVEISFGDEQVAEIFKEKGNSVLIEIFPALENKAWSFDLDALLIILDKAKQEMMRNLSDID